MKTLASVVGVGAITPVGLRAADTAMSHRSSATAMREAPLVDGEGEPITMCFLPTLDPELTGRARAYALAARALEEAIACLGPTTAGLRVRFALAVDEHLAHAHELRLEAQQLATDLSRLLGGATLASPPEVVTRGPASLGFVLPPICDALASGAIDAAIVGGVHTDYDPRRISELASADRLFRSDNVDAVVPGEAAAFVVLVRPDVARKLRLPIRLDLYGIATGMEKARPDNDESAFQASGLTSAMRSALSPVAQEGLAVGWILSDLSFETFRHFELHAASLRNQRLMCEPRHLETPAQRMGLLGAAAVPLHLVLASEAFRRGYAPHHLALSVAGSDAGDRSVVLVGRPT